MPSLFAVNRKKRFGKQWCLRSVAWIAAVAVFCLSLFVWSCSGEQDTGGHRSPAAPQETTYEGNIVAVGDSLTAGLGVAETEAYPARLEARLQADGYRFRVTNAGVSGETSSGTLSRIDWVISTLKPDIVILETGANDGLRGIDPGLIRQNLDQLVRILMENEIQVILAGMRMLPNLGPDYTAAFAAVYPEVAGEREIVLIPFFLEGVAGNPSFNQSDGIHPTAEGYARVVDNIYPYVVEGIRTYRNR